ncbi:uncharacterized protein [Dysidea avara]|uniref:uncharacterized protein n=1 Tax=Dysidea avara TaxID=196820 RepID=UPI0033167343
MTEYSWIQTVKRSIIVTCLFTVACLAGYVYYLLPANSPVLYSHRTLADNGFRGVLSVFSTEQLSYLPNSSTSNSATSVRILNSTGPVKGVKYLSYQPPGNGWNNQRVALENAIVMAKLLNRTLLVHPMAPHDKGAQLKAGANPGYVAYNHLEQSDLVPLSAFVDLSLLSQLMPVQVVATSHQQFYRDFGQLTWRNICHSVGFGYWMDRRPVTSEEVSMFKRQHFHPFNIWRKKCPKEQKLVNHSSVAIVEYLTDYINDTSDMLYFEQGTLFGIHIRFVNLGDAIMAQQWVIKHFRYGPSVHAIVDKIIKRIGSEFNAIHVRRTDHPARKFPVDYWLASLENANCTTDVPLYVATDEKDRRYFGPFKEKGYKLHWASDFHDLLQFDVSPDVVEDFTGIHEQLLCEQAAKFVATPGSTFSILILRNRNEVEIEDGLMMNSLHVFWIGHQMTGV